MIDLMIPRYEVVADYPDSEFKVGDIIEFAYKRCKPFCFTEEAKIEYWFTDFIDRGKKGSTSYCILTFEPHPHLFRHLQWWEKRNIEDMPQYVKSIEDYGVNTAKWAKDEQHKTGLSLSIDGSDFWFNPSFDNMLPATQQEYDAFINSKNQQP